ncbi:O-antigen ligase [Cryobacterium sp. M91]|uniref:O-antigen ligase family protein n=1 Tax=Cryobacterium sp. M91 TaxID=2048294 RepID=UPI0013049BC6|nr:O-antigen ligase family protein [Cryobacterium sp. M91]
MSAAALAVLLARGIALNVSIFGFDAIFIASWVVLVVSALMRTRLERIQLTSVSLALGAIFVGFVVASAVAGSALQGTITIANYMSVLGLAMLLGRSNPKLLAQTLAMVLTFHLAFAYVELLTGKTYVYSTWKLLEATYVNGVPRVSSTIGDPNYFALALLVLSGLISHLRRVLGLGIKYKVVAWVGFGTVLLTFSRAGLVALVLVFVFQGARKNQAREVAVMSIAFASALGLVMYALIPAISNTATSIASRFSSIFESDASLSSRVKFQEFGLDTLLNSGLLGIGPGQFETLSLQLYDSSRPLDLQTQVLNTYLEVLLAGGLVSLVGLLYLMGAAFKRQWALSHFYGALLLGLGVAIFTLDTLQFVYLWLLIGSGLTIKKCGQSLNGTYIGSNRDLQQR